MINLIQKCLFTGNLKVDAQLQSKLCVMGSGFDPKHFEGIIEKYVNHAPFEDLDVFDVYTEGHPNAIVYEAMKNYFEDKAANLQYSWGDLTDIFCSTYDIVSKVIQGKDLWLMKNEISEKIHNSSYGFLKYNDGGIRTLGYDNNKGQIIRGFLIFLLANAKYPNAKRFKKDLIRLEKEYSEQEHSFLPYLWKAFIEHAEQRGEEIQKQTTEKIEHKITSETEPTHIPSFSPFKNEKDALIQKKRLMEFFGENVHIPLNSSKDNHILRCLVWFMEEWDKQGLLIKQPNRDAIRFLETCGFERDGVSVNRIAGKLGDLRRNAQDLGDEKELVRKYMESIAENT